MNTLHKVGGAAALLLGGLFAALVALLFAIAKQGYVPGSGNDPAKALAFAATSPVPYIIYLLCAVLAVLIALIMSALGQRLEDDGPAVMTWARTAGIAAAVLFLAYAMLGFVGEPTLVRVYTQDQAAGAAAYLAVRVVSNGLNTAAIFAVGWAILLSSAAARRAGALPTGLAYLLIVAGAVSILAFLVPVFSLVAPLLYIVWSVWLGMILCWKPVTCQRHIAREPDGVEA